MSRKTIHVIALLLISLFILNNCITVFVPTTSGSGSHERDKPAPRDKNIVKGKFRVYVIHGKRSQYELIGSRGDVYNLIGLSKSQERFLIKMHKRTVNAELRIVPNNRKSRSQDARVIRLW